VFPVTVALHRVGMSICARHSNATPTRQAMRSAYGSRLGPPAYGSARISEIIKETNFHSCDQPCFLFRKQVSPLLFKAAASAAQQYLPPTGLVTPLLSRSITTFTETRSSYRVRRFPSSSSSSSGSCLVGRLFLPRLVEVASSFFFAVLQPKSSVVSHLPPWTIASNLATYLQPSSRSLHLTS
jgi:hypothetical protein